MKAAALRDLFLDYFRRYGHTVVKSSPLVPANDPTLMFTNAGMVQFKDVFVGAETRPYTRATTAQKCMRVSGKHNDLEEVGFTARHHTFFEMLGNFSFGDYFKDVAIELAWRFITREVGLDPKRLWLTVFAGEGTLKPDHEAAALWRKVSGLSDSRILRLGMHDNFWAMGEVGPCGPCTEVHYDLGGKGEPTAEDFAQGRVIEIWNNVFMQFERHKDGRLTPLPKPSVDTGMGLERLAAVVQGELSNYHTDLFAPILARIEECAGTRYRRTDNPADVSMRVIADHARAAAFLVADGVQPSNEGRGYVMRRIMRRAIRHAKKLGIEKPFFARVCAGVVETMAPAYPELAESRALIEKVADSEEQTFRRTLDQGLTLLAEAIARAKASGVLAGSEVFKLYDTYGFPPDLTAIIAQEHGLRVDQDAFERDMAGQRERSRGSEVGEQAVATVYKSLRGRLGELSFVGYVHEDEPLSARPGHWRLRRTDGPSYLEVETTVRALLAEGAEVESASANVVEVVLDPTPFYGESGGQVGDRGVIVDDQGLAVEVMDVQKPVDGLTVARARILSGSIRVGQRLWAGYVPEIRKETRAHHSATHLLHAALRKVLGEHVKQAGSLVDPDHLRFDYAHFEAPAPAQRKAIEDDVNARIQRNDAVETAVLPFDEAKRRGALAFFGDKYGDVVRVVSMGTSVEFCGGTHAQRTGDMGMLLLGREEAIASGVRRIEAEVGAAARRRALETHAKIEQVAAMLRGEAPQAPAGESVLQFVAKLVREHRAQGAALRQHGIEPTRAELGDFRVPVLPTGFGFDDARRVRDVWASIVALASARGNEAAAVAQEAAPHDTGVVAALCALMNAHREDERRLADALRRARTDSAGDWVKLAQEVAGVRLLAHRVDGADGKALREMADALRDKLGSGVVVLAGLTQGKVSLLVAVTRDLVGRYEAGALIQKLAPLVGGRGGGKAELAQAGGSKPEGIDLALATAKELLR